MRHGTSRRIERRIKAHAHNGIAQHVANLLYTVEKQGKPEIWRGFLNLQQSAGREKNRLPHRRNKGCSVYTETEHPLMTNDYSDIIRIERLHQKMRNFLSLIYDDIICYLHFSNCLKCEDNKNINPLE